MKQKNNLTTRKSTLATLGLLTLAMVWLTLSLQPAKKTFAQEKDAPPIQSTTPNILTSPTACVQPPSGLVSWWRAEGNANDFRGLNNGTLQNGATFATGKVGQAFNLDGVNDYVDIPDSPSFTFSSGEISVEAWIKPTADTSGANQAILSQYDSFGQASFFFGLGSDTLPNPRKVKFIVYQSPPNNPNVARGIFTNAIIPLNTFTHVLATFKASTQEIKIYLNGVEAPTTVFSSQNVTSIADLSLPIRIGSVTSAQNAQFLNPFAGLIDEPTIYNRSLSATEVQSIYNADSAGKCLTSSTNKSDFDGDGKSDLSVFRPSNGIWYLLNSQTGFTATQFGISTDRLAPADYDGDGKTDIAVYRDGTWFILRSSLGFTSIQFGIAEDIPQPADFDGDGKAEVAVFRPSNGIWYVFNLVNNQFNGFQFGISEDKPMVGDYDGDGRADYAVFRPSSGIWYYQRTTAGFGAIQFGLASDKPVPADYDGDGKTDVAVFRPSNGIWYYQRSTAGFGAIQFGLNTDKPSPADYDGDGTADVAVFRPSNGIWYLQRSTFGFTGIQFGIAEDKPIPNAFVP